MNIIRRAARHVTGRWLVSLLTSCTTWHIGISFKTVANGQFMTKAFSEAYGVSLGRYEIPETSSRMSFANYTNSKLEIFRVCFSVTT